MKWFSGCRDQQRFLSTSMEKMCQGQAVTGMGSFPCSAGPSGYK